WGSTQRPILIRLDLRRRCCMDRISDEERRRIAELLAEGAPVWRVDRGVQPGRGGVRGGGGAVQRRARGEAAGGPRRGLATGRGGGEVARGVGGGRALGGIGRGVGGAPSTVCREVAANGGAGRYRACAADRRAVRLAHRPKPAKLAACPRLRQVVESKLERR